MTDYFGNNFNLRVPIVQGPMGGVAGPELVAAVANAGGLGILPIWHQPAQMAARAIAETQALTDSAFGVNVRADLKQIEHIRTALDAGVSIIHLFWGDPSDSMRQIDAAGARMIATIGDTEAAKIALDAGASALIAQGIEAGGHVLGDTPLRSLLESVVSMATDVPVIAAGGLADAEDVAEMIDAGASGVLLGTRFVMTEESMAHDDYKRLLLNAGADSTARSLCFDGTWPDAPHRILQNSTLAAWDSAGQPDPGSRPGEGDIVLKSDDVSFPRYSVMPPIRGMVGDIGSAALYAGMGVAKINDCPSVADLVDELVSKIPH